MSLKKIESIVPLGFSCAARAVQRPIESRFFGVVSDCLLFVMSYEIGRAHV